MLGTRPDLVAGSGPSDPQPRLVDPRPVWADRRPKLAGLQTRSSLVGPRPRSIDPTPYLVDRKLDLVVGPNLANTGPMFADPGQMSSAQVQSSLAQIRPHAGDFSRRGATMEQLDLHPQNSHGHRSGTMTQQCSAHVWRACCEMLAKFGSTSLAFDRLGVTLQI